MRHFGSRTLGVTWCVVLAAGCAWRPAATVPLAPESRVRMTWERTGDPASTPSAVEARVVRAVGDSLVVLVDGDREPRAVSLATIAQLEVLQRRSNGGKGAAIGLAIGGVLGAVLGALAGDDCSGADDLCISHEGGALLLGTTGAVSGVLLGTLFGAVSSPAEHWQPVPVEPAGVSFNTPTDNSAGVQSLLNEGRGDTLLSPVDSVVRRRDRSGASRHDPVW